MHVWTDVIDFHHWCLVLDKQIYHVFKLLRSYWVQSVVCCYYMSYTYACDMLEPLLLISLKLDTFSRKLILKNYRDLCLTCVLLISKLCLSIFVTGLSHWKSYSLKKRTCNFKIDLILVLEFFSRNSRIIAIYDKLIEKLMFSINVVQPQFFRNHSLNYTFRNHQVLEKFYQKKMMFSKT